MCPSNRSPCNHITSTHAISSTLSLFEHNPHHLSHNVSIPSTLHAILPCLCLQASTDGQFVQRWPQARHQLQSKQFAYRKARWWGSNPVMNASRQSKQTWNNSLGHFAWASTCQSCHNFDNFVAYGVMTAVSAAVAALFQVQNAWSAHTCPLALFCSAILCIVDSLLQGPTHFLHSKLAAISNQAEKLVQFLIIQLVDSSSRLWFYLFSSSLIIDNSNELIVIKGLLDAP